MPTEEEAAEIVRKANFRDGAVNVDELPKSIIEKIGAESRIDGLLEDMATTREMGGVGRFRTTDGTENFSYEKEWMGVKSPLPKELQQGFTWAEIESVIEKGRYGEDLTPRQQRFYEDVVAWATKNRGTLDPLKVQAWLDKNGVPVELTPVREQVAEEAVGAQERAAIAAEDAGSPGDFSAADLEHRQPTAEPLRHRARHGALARARRAVDRHHHGVRR